LQFFLTAVRRQADDAVTRASKLVEVRDRYAREAAKSRSRVGELLDLLFRNPFVTVTRVERALGMTNQGARNLIRDAAKRGWLVEIGAGGRGGRAYWIADEFGAFANPLPARKT